MKLFRRKSKFLTRQTQKAVETLPKLTQSKSLRPERSPKISNNPGHEIFPVWLLQREDFQQILSNSEINTKYLIKACTKPHFLRDEEKEQFYLGLKPVPLVKPSVST